MHKAGLSIGQARRKNTVERHRQAKAMVAEGSTVIEAAASMKISVSDLYKECLDLQLRHRHGPSNDRMRRAYIMHLNDMTYGQIGEELGVSYTTARNYCIKYRKIAGLKG